MKKLYFIFSGGECGEVDGVFDENENIIGYWFCNDATWRNEYFSGFMKSLGFECIAELPAKDRTRLEKKLLTKLKKEGW